MLYQAYIKYLTWAPTEFDMFKLPVKYNITFPNIDERNHNYLLVFYF